MLRILSILLVVFLYGCFPFGEEQLENTHGNDTDSPEELTIATYTSGTLSGRTDSEGLFRFESDGIGMAVELRVETESSTTLADAWVDYTESDETVVVRAGKEGYNEALLLFERSEFVALLESSARSPGYQESSVILFVTLTLAVAALASAELAYIADAYEVETFYLSNVLEENQAEGYIAWCKTPQELAEFMYARVSSLLTIGDAMLGVVAFASSASTHLSDGALDLVAELSSDFYKDGVDGVRDGLLAMYFQEWGRQLGGDEVHWTVHNYDLRDRSNGFSKMYAPIVIYPDEPCVDSTDDTGLESVAVSSRNVEICIWDHGEIDNDVVDIHVNGQLKVDNYTLTGSPQCWTETFAPGDNTVTVIAVNEGAKPPNTASISLSNVIQGPAEQIWEVNQGSQDSFTVAAPF